MRRRITRFAQLLAVAAVAAVTLSYAGTAPAETAATHSAADWTYVKTIDQAVCQTVYTGGFLASYYTRGECTRVDFSVTNTNTTSSVKVNFIGPDGGAPFRTQTASRLTSGLWRVVFRSDATWPAGKITLEVVANGVNAGDGALFVNALGADVKAAAGNYAPGARIPVEGRIAELTDIAGGTERTGVPAKFFLQARAPDGRVLHRSNLYTAASDGSFPADLAIPAEATEGISAGPETNFEADIGIDIVDASHTNAVSGAWASKVAGSGSVTITTPPQNLLLDAKFVSSLGWVKPGQTYPFRVLVKNFTGETKTGAATTITAPDGVTFVGATPLAGAGTATVESTSIAWRIGPIPTGTVATLVVEARADTLGADPEIVWKDLSTKATLAYDGYTGDISSTTRGPKVIPPKGGFETARYGDKPFPIIPVDFRDRKHKSHRTGRKLAQVVNDPNYPGSTYNLYQEMSFGQLHPFGSVPSASIASAGFDYAQGFNFTERDVAKPTCRGATLASAKPAWGTPLYPERIKDGWYQLPGDTEYYGGDFPVFTATTIGIDSACGDTGKLVYDAVQIADPEIDYNQFDSDKDGLVDFTMVVFVGCGGNGGSQLTVSTFCEDDDEPYDNPWPHSSSLESGYTDQATGLSGYISDDQLTDLEGTPQCWTGADRSNFADCAANGGTGRDDLPVYVRVGPYNINPENAMDQASVIAHEYGHHLGLPDFYSGYSAYNDWNLMATDYSQHMTVFGKQELGWVVPRFLQPGDTRNVSDWEEIKNDTGEIQWRTPSGRPYTLSAANGDQNIHNGEAYALKLPPKLIIDPEKVQEQTSGDDAHLWWSGRGNDFGCAPKAGHNLDISLPDDLVNVPEGTPITMTFKSSWDIEWDFDYGFVLTSTDGATYTSLPSKKGYSTPKAFNPHNVACLNTFDNGLTGTSGAAAAGPHQVAADRAASNVSGGYGSGSPFVVDEYDLSHLRGKEGVRIRFSYSTDAGLDRPGWFIDDLEIKAGDQVIYSSDFAEEDELRLFPGGCGDEGMKVASKCTVGWSRINASQPSELDHAYYLELRDRSGFDFSGRGQADRGAIGWSPGVLVEYTDEARGYGNNGAGPPPRQHYIDSQPQPNYDCGDNLVEDHPEPAALTLPRCQDAAFTANAGDSHFDDVGWVDNFWDDSSPDGLWHFDYGCLTLDVTSMAGDTGNTEALPSDITAGATISAGSGCSPFEYWAAGANAAPTAVATATPKTTGTGQTVTFDATGTFDDVDTSDELAYQWAFGDGSTATGATATHVYAAKGTYEATLTVTDSRGLSDTAHVVVTVLGPDLQVTNLTTTSVKRTVTVTATVHNAGPGSAPASRTEFLLDGTTVLGTVETPALAAGQSADVSVRWDTRKVKGAHQLKATADKPGAIGEENEANNVATLSVTVQGNEVQNGDFEQVNESGAPTAWSSESTGAGTASTTSTGGTDGSNAAQMSGSGGNAAIAGSPTWTSDAFAVEAGRVYDVTASVSADGLSSAPSLGLVYLGAAGQVLDTVKVLSAPLQTDGFRALEQSVTIPPLVTQVRVVLTGFAPTDLATKGTVTFDDVGVYAH